jgi:dCTP deaminase
MILSDVDIKDALKTKKIILIPPPDDTQIQSSALDLRLGTEFKSYNEKLLKVKGIGVVIDYSDLDSFAAIEEYLEDLPKEHDGSVIIKPHTFILAKTLEIVKLPLKSQLAARVEGRSSIARLGLTVHLSAPTIHAGFMGRITLEIINHGYCSIKLDPKRDKICQLIFEELKSIPSKANLSQFHGQKTVVGKTK